MLSAAPFPPRSPEGIAKYVYNLTLKFVERGHDVTVITRGSSWKIEEEHVQVLNALVRVYRVPTIPLYPLHVHIEGLLAKGLLRSLEPQLDIVHVHSPYVPAVKTCAVPIITTIHTLEGVDIAQYEGMGFRRLAFKMSAPIFASMELSLFRNSKMLTAVSDHVFDELERYYSVSRKGVVLGNGVNEIQFSPLNKGSDEQYYVLYVGRMEYRKGLYDLVRCAKQVCEERPDVSFILVGNGPLAGSIVRESRRIGIARNVVLAGYVSESRLVELYQNASVCVIPSHYEGLPTVMLEAMSCGVPVVATDIGGQVDVISNGMNGYLVPVKSPRRMARIICALLSNENLRKTVGRAARRTIEERYTWDIVSSRVLECYSRLLAS
jgi:glycosyltransferase involved in cell wall biosynthesis